MRFIPLLTLILITSCSTVTKKMVFKTDASNIKDCQKRENSDLPICERIRTTYPYCFSYQGNVQVDECQRFFDCFINGSIKRDHNLLCGHFLKQKTIDYSSALSEKISHDQLKINIDSCRETIRKTRPNFSLVDCDESQASCKERIIRMAPSIDCTYHLEPCKQEARKQMLNNWKNQIPESCHELKKKYPKSFFQHEGEMP